MLASLNVTQVTSYAPFKPRLKMTSFSANENEGHVPSYTDYSQYNYSKLESIHPLSGLTVTLEWLHVGLHVTLLTVGETVWLLLSNTVATR